VDFFAAVKHCFQNYANANGRATRSEYWYFFLFVIGLQIVLRIVFAPLAYVFDLGVFLPGIAVGVRRLHDIDRPGLWLLIGFVPIVGTIVLIVWFCQKSDPVANRYGPPPLPLGALTEET
jgi:uncharacterized membrane protein YhaH (DUF805 family)